MTRLSMGVLAAALITTLSACTADVSGDQPVPSALVDAIDDGRLEGDALDLCNSRAPAPYVAAFRSSPREVRELAMTAPNGAKDIDRLPEEPDAETVVCIDVLETESGAKHIATWIAWDASGNSPSGILGIF